MSKSVSNRERTELKDPPPHLCLRPPPVLLLQYWFICVLNCPSRVSQHYRGPEMNPLQVFHSSLFIVLPAVPHLLQELHVEEAGVGRSGQGVWVDTWHRYGVLVGPRPCRQGNNGEEEDHQCCPLNPGQAPPDREDDKWKIGFIFYFKSIKYAELHSNV